MRHPPRFALAHAVALVAAIAVRIGAGETVTERDLWYLGLINNQPSVTVHVVVQRQSDGTRTNQIDTRIVLSRLLGGAVERLEMGESRWFEEGVDGRLRRFRCDSEELGGGRSSAVGTVTGNEIIATVLRLGRSDEVRLSVPADLPLLGEQAGQELFARTLLKPGDRLVSGSPMLTGGTVVLARSTVVLKERRADGNLVCVVTADVMPIPTETVVTPTGDLVSMAMKLGGVIDILVKPSDGPVALKGAELAPGGLVTAKGPAPKAAAANRYRLPDEVHALLPADDFQSLAGGILTVTTVARPAALTDRATFLKREPQLETDDPELRAFVTGIAKPFAGKEDDASRSDLAELLRLAVRAHISQKDLSKGDGSALETFRDRRGDCTEHANLLCATLRIAGIPSRTEVGLVFAADFGGWVGHAWTSAWIGDRWTHLDAAYPGIMRSQYLKLATTSGDGPLRTGAAMLAAAGALFGKTVETVP